MTPKKIFYRNLSFLPGLISSPWSPGLVQAGVGVVAFVLLDFPRLLTLPCSRLFLDNMIRRRLNMDGIQLEGLKKKYN